MSDDVPEARAVLETLGQLAPDAAGIVLDDQDQGWRIRFALAGGAAFFVEWDAEGPTPSVGGYAVDAAALAVQANGALARLETIHRRLVRALGSDRWT